MPIKLIQYYDTFTWMNNERKREKISEKSSVDKTSKKLLSAFEENNMRSILLHVTVK